MASSRSKMKSNIHVHCRPHAASWSTYGGPRAAWQIMSQFTGLPIADHRKACISVFHGSLPSYRSLWGNKAARIDCAMSFCRGLCNFVVAEFARHHSEKSAIFYQLPRRVEFTKGLRFVTWSVTTGDLGECLFNTIFKRPCSGGFSFLPTKTVATLAFAMAIAAWPRMLRTLRQPQFTTTSTAASV